MTVAMDTIHVDNTLSFGCWGDEDIMWRVLDVQDGLALLITQKAIDCKSFHVLSTSIRWKDCSLRAWLNDEFLHEAFDEVQRRRIIEVTIPNPGNPRREESGEPATMDRIFCLSVDEAYRFFRSDEDRMCYPTEHARRRGAWANTSNGACWWWLRSPGAYANYAGVVNAFGNVLSDGDCADINYYAVRPALWLEL